MILKMIIGTVNGILEMPPLVLMAVAITPAQVCLLGKRDY